MLKNLVSTIQRYLYSDLKKDFSDLENCHIVHFTSDNSKFSKSLIMILKIWYFLPPSRT